MKDSLVHDVLVRWGPTAVLWVAGISVGLTVVAAFVLVISKLLGEKDAEHAAHDGHGPSSHHASH
jgi:hypothetical protein